MWGLQMVPAFGKLKVSLPWACIIIFLWWYWIAVSPARKIYRFRMSQKPWSSALFLGLTWDLRTSVKPQTPEPNDSNLCVCLICFLFLIGQLFTDM